MTQLQSIGLFNMDIVRDNYCALSLFCCTIVSRLIKLSEQNMVPTNRNIFDVNGS